MCGFESCVGKRHQRCPKQALLEPCEPVVSKMSRQLIPREALGYEVPVFSWGKAPGSSAIENRGTESRGRASPSPVGGGVMEADRARQRRKELARKLAKISPPDQNISLENRAVEGGVKKQQEKG